MQDGIGRQIDYLRISVTDKCNLRCKYCMPPEGVKRISHEEILSLEELFRIIRIMEGLGISKVRFTGGEPLVRKNLSELIKNVHENTAIEEITLTTNGVLLGEQLEALKAAGITSVNISLDTRRPEIFRQITGADAYEKVMASIRLAITAGVKVKINCVPCLEWNAEEIESMALLAKELPVDVRFIELMPVGCGREYHGVPSDQVLTRLRIAFGEPTVVSKKIGNGPAEYYAFDTFRGRIGLISPMSHQFCQSCNRVRLTAEGRLKLCLHYNIGISLKPMIRSGNSDEEIRQAILGILQMKPLSHDFRNQKADDADKEIGKMVQIGG